jgi:hypothetical protein
MTGKMAARIDPLCKAFDGGFTLTVPSASTPPPLPPTTVAARRAVNDHCLFNKGSFGNRGRVYSMGGRGLSAAEGHEQDDDCSKQSDDQSLTRDGHWFLHRCLRVVSVLVTRDENVTHADAKGTTEATTATLPVWRADAWACLHLKR